MTTHQTLEGTCDFTARRDYSEAKIANRRLGEAMMFSVTMRNIDIDWPHPIDWVPIDRAFTMILGR